jgi:hypothetical protein
MMRTTFIFCIAATLDFCSDIFVNAHDHDMHRTQSLVYSEYAQRHRRERVSTRSLQVIDPKSCKSGKGRTCSPSAKPSTAPSLAPTISHMPTISFLPSAEPSISSPPSVMPSPGPTPFPSVVPSGFPSPQPSDGPTQTPTISSPPTINPTEMPSDKPSKSPTVAPTVSSQPTITGQPSGAPVIDPNGVIDRIVSDADGHTGVETSCRRSIPSEANSVSDQLIVYNYDLSIASGSDTYFIVDQIAAAVQRSMSEQFLTCIFDNTTNSFLTSTVSSLPVDVVDTSFTNCTSSDGSECRRVNAAFTSTIFYLNGDNRKLQNGTDSSVPVSDAIMDPKVFESFSSALNSLFSSGQLTSDISNVVSTSFQGITNDESSVPTPAPDESSSSDKSLSSGAVAGSVIGTLIGVALIAVLIALAVVTIRNRNGGTSRSKAVDVTQQDFNDLNDYEEEDDRDDRAMMDRSVIASDDGSYNSGYKSQGKLRTSAYIVNDDNESYNTGAFPAVGPSFSERVQSASAPGPIFVKANEILSQLHQAELKTEFDSETGAVEMNAYSSRHRSTGKRSYDVPDTVQL